MTGTRFGVTTKSMHTYTVLRQPSSWNCILWQTVGLIAMNICHVTATPARRRLPSAYRYCGKSYLPVFEVYIFVLVRNGIFMSVIQAVAFMPRLRNEARSSPALVLRKSSDSRIVLHTVCLVPPNINTSVICFPRQSVQCPAPTSSTGSQTSGLGNVELCTTTQRNDEQTLGFSRHFL